jgi:hypothetical protein
MVAMVLPAAGDCTWDEYWSPRFEARAGALRPITLFPVRPYQACAAGNQA